MVRLGFISTLVVAPAAAADPKIYKQPVTTTNGCECKSECTTGTLNQYCNVDEWCKVDSSCPNAAWSLVDGNYDWCVFQPDQSYESRSAAEKQQILLNKHYQDQTPSTYPSALNVLGGVLGESVWTTFDAGSDVFPHDRTKYIHTVGVTGGIRFVSNGNHPYQGLFEGAEHGIVRFSSAKEPSSGGFTPGMGIKFLRDGRPSANFVAMYTLDGQTCDEDNFFQHEWSNHIPMTDNFGLKIVAAKFWQASYCPLMVGLSDLASSDYKQPAPAGSSPWQLIFEAKTGSQCNCNDYSGCLNNLQNIAEGTELFEVHALEGPGARKQSIGVITLTSPLKTGKFGDEQLFFRHQRMEEDFEANPQWLDQIDKKNECGMSVASTEAPPREKGCTSPFHGADKLADMLEDDMTV